MLESNPGFTKLFHNRPRIRRPKIVHHRPTDNRPQIANLLNLFAARGHQRINGFKFISQQDRCALADMADAQTEQNPLERALFALLNAFNQIVRRLFAHALKAEHLDFFQGIQLRRRFNQPAVHQLFHQRFPEAVDIHGSARCKMGQPVFNLSGALQIIAAQGHLALAFFHLSAADGTGRGHGEYLLRARPFFGDHPYDSGNNFTGFFNHHAVADVNILAPNFVLVVERGAFNGGAGELHRIQFRNRRENAGAPHLNGDGAQRGFGLLRLIFIGNRPARAFSGGSQRFVETALVDLDYAAVHLERKFMTHGFEHIELIENFFNRRSAPIVGCRA